jgi:hypothetical protein
MYQFVMLAVHLIKEQTVTEIKTQHHKTEGNL